MIELQPPLPRPRILGTTAKKSKPAFCFSHTVLTTVAEAIPLLPRKPAGLPKKKKSLLLPTSTTQTWKLMMKKANTSSTRMKKKAKISSARMKSEFLSYHWLLTHLTMFQRGKASSQKAEESHLRRRRGRGVHLCFSLRERSASGRHLPAFGFFCSCRCDFRPSS